MIAGHERSVALYRAQAQGGEDQDLRKYAHDTLPTIEHHLAELRRNAEMTRPEGNMLTMRDHQNYWGLPAWRYWRRPGWQPECSAARKSNADA